MKAVFVVAALVLCACAFKLPKLTLPKFAKRDTQTYTPKPIECAYTIRYHMKEIKQGVTSDVSGYDCGYGDSAVFTSVRNIGDPFETTTFLRADIDGGEEGQALQVQTVNSSGVEMCVDTGYVDNQTEVGYIWEYVEGEFEYNKVEKGVWAGEECDVYYVDGFKDMLRTYVKDERVFGIYKDYNGEYFEVTCWCDDHAYADDYVVSSLFQGCSAGVYQPIVRLDDCELETGSHPEPPPDPSTGSSSSYSSEVSGFSDSSDTPGSGTSAAFSIKAFAVTVLGMVMGVLISSF